LPSNDSGPTALFRSSSERTLPVGYVLSQDYEIRHVLGRGGFGVTYKAYDRTVDIELAIKEYFPAGFASRGADQMVIAIADHDQQFDWGKERFVHESQLLARFKHDNIVRLFRAFRANGTAYSALELVNGQPLNLWMAGLKRRPTQIEMDMIFEPLVDALGYIHSHNLLHRDLSPDNILIRSGQTGATNRLAPIMLDFGAAKEFFRKHESMVTGVQLSYSPGEQYVTDGSLQGPWTDIYSLSAVMYSALTGSRPADFGARMLADDMAPLRTLVQTGLYRNGFLDAVDWGFRLRLGDRPQSVAEWAPVLFSSRAATRLRKRPTAASKIFLSYRREDTKHVAGRIFDRLAQEFGEKEVFFDVDTIPVGVDFRSHVTSSIEDSAVLIALIGDRWANHNWQKRRWWMSPFRNKKLDFVEVEIEIALQSSVPIIPVLVDSASMPKESLLPGTIRSLSYLNATQVRSGRDFRTDIERVVELIRELRSEPKAT
jgi:serine/threonine protein kinase